MPFGLSFRNVQMKAEFMTLMSCDSVCCMYGMAWSSRRLMMQLINGQHACVLVFMSMADILNIAFDYQYLFSLYLMNFVSHHASCSG